MAQEIRRETVETEILDGHPTTLFQITVQEGKEEVSNYRPIESSSRSD